MNPTLITDLLTYALPSGFLAGTVTWLVSRRKRRNDMLADMQRSIDCCAKSTTTYCRRTSPCAGKKPTGWSPNRNCSAKSTN